MNLELHKFQIIWRESKSSLRILIVQVVYSNATSVTRKKEKEKTMYHFSTIDNLFYQKSNLDIIFIILLLLCNNLLYHIIFLYIIYIFIFIYNLSHYITLYFYI